MRKLNLSDEEALLLDLYSRYEEAGAELEHLVKDLMLSVEDPRVIHQMEYQDELEERIQDILGKVAEDDEESVGDFLGKCAELGFIGALYSMYHQGLDKDVRLVHRVKSDYAERLLYHNAQLQRDVKSEITRGIASRMRIEDISRNVSGRMNATRSKVATVARTEGGRVFEENNYSAMVEARSLGASLVKEWSSMLDSKVRNDHLTLHGQVVPVDEPFELHSEDGNTYYAMYPHDFGVAKEDVNCRCTAFPRMKDPGEPVKGYDTYDVFKEALIAAGMFGLLAAMGDRDADGA